MALRSCSDSVTVSSRLLRILELILWRFSPARLQSAVILSISDRAESWVTLSIFMVLTASAVRELI